MSDYRPPDNYFVKIRIIDILILTFSRSNKSIYKPKD